MEKLSVIIPCYNDGKFLREELNSVLKQKYKNLEIICLNDCSIDDTLSILNDYSQLDNRIKIYSNDKNEGLIFTLNKLVQLSTCPILVRMNPDDVCEEKRIEVLYKTLVENNADLVSSDYSLIDENSDWVRKKGFTLLETDLGIKFTAIFNSPFPHPQSMIKRKILVEHIYDFNYKAAEDYKLWTDLLLLKNFKGKIVNQQLYRYRINPNGMSLSNNNLQVDNHIKISKRYLSNILNIKTDGIEFWKIAKKTYSYKNSIQDLNQQFFHIKKIKDIFISKFSPNNEEIQEIKSYTFQYLIFCYKKIFEATREEKLSTRNAIKVIFKSMLNNVNLISIKNVIWLIRNK